MFSAAPLESRRRWIALTAATVVMQFSYWFIALPLSAADPEQSGELWLGLAVTPFVFLVLSFASRHPRAPGATGKAMGMFLLVALPVGLGNVVVGLVAGYGAGAVLSLRREEGLHPIRGRVIAVAAASLYLFVLIWLSTVVPGLATFAIMSGAVLPLAVVGIADEVAEARDRDRASTRP